MGSTMVVGILVLLSLVVMPSSAQQAAPCWAKIAPCLETAKAQQFAADAVAPCCPAISSAMIDETACFCSAKADVLSQDAEIPFNDILSTCKITATLEDLCPDTPSSTPSTTPSTPGATPSTASGTPSTPARAATTTSTSNNGATQKITIKSISGMFMILMPFII